MYAYCNEVYAYFLRGFKEGLIIEHTTSLKRPWLWLM